jgi:hypothetical protein
MGFDADAASALEDAGVVAQSKQLLITTDLGN